MTMDLDRTVLALPHLLRQLDIPVDAVGVVAEGDGTSRDPINAFPVVAVMPDKTDYEGYYGRAFTCPQRCWWT